MLVKLESPGVACAAVRTWVVTYIQKFFFVLGKVLWALGKGVGHCLDCGLISMDPETSQRNNCLTISWGTGVIQFFCTTADRL